MYYWFSFRQANTPLSSHIANLLGFDYDEADCPIKTAAVCVYPAKVGIAVKTLRRLGANNINVASGNNLLKNNFLNL